MKLSEMGVQRPVFTLMVFLAAFVLGAVMVPRLPVDLLPEIEQPTITVMTYWEGASAEDVESKVTKLIERALGTVNNLDQLRSTTTEGISSVVCEFVWGTDLDEASNDIRDNLERIRRRLPDEVDPPALRKFNTAQIPILYFGVTADENIEKLKEIIENDVADPLARLPGVGSVDLFGGLERQIRIRLDPARLAAYGLVFEEVAAVLARENVTLPAGNLQVGVVDYTLRVPGEYGTPEEIGSIVVRSGNGAFVELKDVAEVEDGFADERRIARVGGRRAMMMMVQKRSGANTVAVVRAVKKELEVLEANLPRDVELTLIFDSSLDIVQSISNVMTGIRWAFLFVALTTLFFLRNVRSSLIITLTIPFALIFAVIFMWVMGWTINIISMASLAIAVGMVVDNAVVVLENISTKVDAGTAPREAAMFGADEVGTAVMASTVTTIVVFLPLIFLRGEAGIMFKQLGGLLVATLTASLVCALWLTPMLSSKLLMSKRRREARKGMMSVFVRWSEEKFAALDAAYSRLLRRALGRRWLVLILAVLVFGSSLILFNRLGSEYSPEDDNGRIQITLQLPIGTRVEETTEVSARAMEVALEKAGMDNVVAYALRAGESGWGSGGTHVGNLMVRLVPQTQRKVSNKDVGRAIGDVISAWPEVQRITVNTSQSGPGRGRTATGKPISIEVLGFDFEQMQTIAEQVAEVVRNTAGTVDVEITRDPGRPEIRVEIDRVKAAAHGLTVSQVANGMRTLFYGDIATQYRDADEDHDIVLRLDDPYRQTVGDVAQAEIARPDGKRVRIASIAQVEERLGALNIDRKNQERVIRVEADVHGRSSGDVVRELRERVHGELVLPSGIGIYFAGSAEDQEEAFRDMILMVILGIVLVYMVMASQFESLLDPFLILFSIPFAFTGVAIMLTVLSLTISIMSLIGMILLVGLVVNNAIVLIDYINLLRARGESLGDAIQNAGRSRLRPVMITTMTTTLGMLPLVLGRGEGSAMWRPMAATIIGGLIVSMLITLVFVPTLYSLAHSRQERRRVEAAAQKGATA